MEFKRRRDGLPEKVVSPRKEMDTRPLGCPRPLTYSGGPHWESVPPCPHTLIYEVELWSEPPYKESPLECQGVHLSSP